MPPACSMLALAMSATIAATFLIELTISPSELPARLTRSTPSRIWPAEPVSGP
jgi:hypothetical protein